MRLRCLRFLSRVKSWLRYHVPLGLLDVDAFYVFMRPLTHDFEETDRRWTNRWATREDADSLRQIDNVASEVVRSQLGDGFCVALVENAGSIIAFKVMATQSRKQGIFEFALPEDGLFHIYIWVSPEWRGQDLVNVMHRFTSQKWRRHGYRWSFATGNTYDSLLVAKGMNTGSIIY